MPEPTVIRSSADSAGAAADTPGWITHQLTVTPSQPATALIDREWLLTNGTGAFAMGSAAGVNTRRYHGLLVASTKPPVGRVVALSHVLEQLVLPATPGGAAGDAASGAGAEAPAGKKASAAPTTQTIEFSSLMFRDDKGGEVLAPQGLSMLRKFERGLAVRWQYTWGEIELSRELHLHWKEQAATIRYRVKVPAASFQSASEDAAPAGAPPTDGKTKKPTKKPTKPALTGPMLRLSPMLAMRDFHALLHKSGGAAPKVTAKKGAMTATVKVDKLTVTLAVSSGGFVANAAEQQWWFNAFYRADAARGQEDREDYFVPGAFEIPLSPDPGGDGVAEVTLTVALGEEPVAPHSGDPARAAHLHAIEHKLYGISVAKPVIRTLAIATDDFVVDRTIKGQKLQTVIAGYPWFSDWGRDTFIALPGLMLATGRFDDARGTLRAFAEAIKDGLVPNRFDDYNDDAAHYNTVDASLWFIRAAVEYVKASGDTTGWSEWIAPACMKIVEAYIRGTGGDGVMGATPGTPMIRMAGDGLITAGNSGTQLTWMDAANNGVVFTPRHGKAVEINALWYYALTVLADILEATHKPTTIHYRKLADRIRRSFAKVFYVESTGGLRDHVWVDEMNLEHPDASIRPNMIFAVSLPHSPLPRTKQIEVLRFVKEKLVTPLGLRTLPPDDPHYHPRYTGDMFHRDEAYHQGTVWPWLIGPYAEAILRTGDFSEPAKQEAMAAIAPLLDLLEGDGLGQLPEVCDADGPHRPGGCPAQAWSIAEVARVLWLIRTGG